MAQMVKNPPAMQETWVRSLGWEDPLEGEMATHASILAQRIPWSEEPGGCSPQGRTESDTTELKLTCCPEETGGLLTEPDSFLAVQKAFLFKSFETCSESFLAEKLVV